MDGGVFGELSTDSLQLGFLLVARDGDVAPLPGGDALLQGGVVELAAAPEHVVQRPLLSGRGSPFLFVRLASRLHVTASLDLARAAALQRPIGRAPVPYARR